MFEQAAPYYMSIGMSREEYWNSNDPQILREYIEADRLRQERQNAEAWLQGMYFFTALSTALANFGAQKGTQPKQYPEKPFEISKPKKTKRDEKQEAVWAEAYMSSMVQAGKGWGKSSQK